MRNLIRLTTFIFLLGIFMTGCYYDKEDILYPSTPCDSVNITYSGTITLVMISNCNVCHNKAEAPGGVVTDNYDDLNIIAKDGRLWGVVDHQSGFPQMPKDLPKLSVCDLTKIKKWVDAGSPNN